MKLHLPSGLRKALLACLAAVALPAASIPTTIASASGIAAVFLATSQRAEAEEGFSGPSGVSYTDKGSYSGNSMEISEDAEVTVAKDNAIKFTVGEGASDIDLKVNGTAQDSEFYNLSEAGAIGAFNSVWFAGTGRFKLTNNEALSSEIKDIYIGTHTADWSDYLTFEGQGDGLNASLVTGDGEHKGWLKIDGTLSASDLTVDSDTGINTENKVYGNLVVKANTSIDTNGHGLLLSNNTVTIAGELKEEQGQFDLRVNGGGTLALEKGGELHGTFAAFDQADIQLGTASTTGVTLSVGKLRGNQFSFSAAGSNEVTLKITKGDTGTGALGQSAYHSKFNDHVTVELEGASEVTQQFSGVEFKTGSKLKIGSDDEAKFTNVNWGDSTSSFDGELDGTGKLSVVGGGASGISGTSHTLKWGGTTSATFQSSGTLEVGDKGIFQMSTGFSANQITLLTGSTIQLTSGTLKATTLELGTNTATLEMTLTGEATKLSFRSITQSDTGKLTIKLTGWDDFKSAGYQLFDESDGQWSTLWNSIQGSWQDIFEFQDGNGMSLGQVQLGSDGRLTQLVLSTETWSDSIESFTWSMSGSGWGAGHNESYDGGENVVFAGTKTDGTQTVEVSGAVTVAGDLTFKKGEGGTGKYTLKAVAQNMLTVTGQLVIEGGADVTLEFAHDGAGTYKDSSGIRVGSTKVEGKLTLGGGDTNGIGVKSLGQVEVTTSGVLTVSQGWNIDGVDGVRGDGWLVLDVSTNDIGNVVKYFVRGISAAREGKIANVEFKQSGYDFAGSADATDLLGHMSNIWVDSGATITIDYAGQGAVTGLNIHLRADAAGQGTNHGALALFTHETYNTNGNAALTEEVKWGITLEGNGIVQTGLTEDGDKNYAHVMKYTGTLTNEGGHTLVKKGVGVLELAEGFSAGSSSSGTPTIDVQKGSLKLSYGTSDALKDYTVTLTSGATLESGITGTVKALTGTGTLNVTGGKLTLGTAQGSTLTNLHLAEGAELVVNAGSFTISGGWTWGENAKLTLSALQQKITLSGISQLNGNSSTNKLTIYLNNAFFGSIDGTTGIQLFDSSGFSSGWEEYFTIEAADSVAYQDLQLDSTGKLTWTKAEASTLTWNKDSEQNTWDAAGANTNWGTSEHWSNGGSVTAIFSDETGEEVTVDGAVKAAGVEVRQGTGWTFKVDGENTLTVSGGITVSGSSKLTISGGGKVSTANVTPTDGDLELSETDLLFSGSITGKANALTGTGYALYTGNVTSWTDFTGKFGSTLGTGVGYGVSMSSQDLTISGDATIDRAFKVEGNTHSLSFDAGLTVASGGSIVIGKGATLKLAEKLERDSGNSATIQFSGNGTLEFDMGGDKHFKSFSTAAETKVKANITGNWAFMEDADIDGTLDVVGGHELIFEGTNNIAHLTATQGASSLSKLSLKYSITTSNVSTTIGTEGDDSLSIGELNMEAGSLTLNYTNVTVTGLIDSSQTDAVGTITGKSLTVNNVGDNTSYNGSLTLTGDFAKTAEGKLVIQGGPTGSGSLSFGGKVDISGGVVEFGKTTGGVDMSVGGNLTVNNSGGAFTWVATDKNLSVTGATTLNGILTLKGGENTLTGAVTASNGTLKVEGGSLKLVGGLAGTLSKLTLGAGAKMEVSAGTSFTIEGNQSWGWGSNAEITLAQDVKIKLGSGFTFDSEVSSSNKLTINLTTSYLTTAQDSVTKFFDDSSTWQSGWEEYFDFNVTGDDAHTYDELKLKSDGTLTWAKAPTPGTTLYWGVGDDLGTGVTLGTGGDQQWGSATGSSTGVTWSGTPEVHLEAVSDTITVTVGEGATMASLSTTGAATYNLTARGAQTATVNGTLSVGEGTTLSVGSNVTLDVKQTYSGTGTLQLDGGKVSFDSTSETAIEKLNVSSGQTGDIEIRGNLTIKDFGAGSWVGSLSTSGKVTIKQASGVGAGGGALTLTLNPTKEMAAWINGDNAGFTLGEGEARINIKKTGIQKQIIGAGKVEIFGDVEVEGGILQFTNATSGSTIHGSISGAGTLTLAGGTNITIAGKDGDAGSINHLSCFSSSGNPTLHLGGDLTFKQATSDGDSNTKGTLSLNRASGVESVVYLLWDSTDNSEELDWSAYQSKYAENKVTFDENTGYGKAGNNELKIKEAATIDQNLKVAAGTMTFGGAATLSKAVELGEGATLNFNGGVSGTLTKLTLGKNATVKIASGEALTLTGQLSWGQGAKLDLDSQLKITLSGGSLVKPSSSDLLTIDLLGTVLTKAGSGQWQLFEGWNDVTNWNQYIKFTVDGSDVGDDNFKGLALDSSGKLTWEAAEPTGDDLYWGTSDADHKLTLGTTDGAEWSHETGQSGTESWVGGKNVYLEATDGDPAEVTVVDGANMANLTVQAGTTYSFTGKGKTLEVSDTLTLNTSATFEAGGSDQAGLNVSAKKLVVNADGGTVDFGGGLTITNGTGNGITVEKGSVTLSGGTVRVGVGTTSSPGIELKEGTSLTVKKDGVTLEQLGFVQLGEGAELVLEQIGSCTNSNTIVYGKTQDDGSYVGTVILSEMGETGAAEDLSKANNILPSGSNHLGEIVLRDSHFTVGALAQNKLGNVSKLTIEKDSTLEVTNWSVLDSNGEGTHAVHLSGGDGTEQAKLTLKNAEMTWNLVLDDNASVSTDTGDRATGGFFKGQLTANGHTLTMEEGKRFQLRTGFSVADGDKGLFEVKGGNLELNYATEDQTAGGDSSATQLTEWGITLSGGGLLVGTEDSTKAVGSSYTIKYLTGENDASTLSAVDGTKELVIDFDGKGIDGENMQDNSASVKANVTGGNLMLTKKGAGTQSIEGSYAGDAIKVQGGKLELKLTGDGTAGAVSVAGELAVENHKLTISDLSGTAGSITGSGTLELTADEGSFGGSIGTNFTYNATSPDASKSFKLTGEFTGGELKVQQGTLEAAMGGTIATKVTLAGGTLKTSTSDLTVAALELSAGSKLDVQKNLTVTTLTGSGSLTSLTLAAGATLTVQAGGFTVDGAWSWDTGSAVTLGTKGQKITLGSGISFVGASSGNRLTFNLTKAYLEDAENGVTEFFGGGWQSDQGATWKDYFTFKVTDDFVNWKNLHLDENGFLAWDAKEGLEWKGDESDNTWSGTGQSEWEDAEGGGDASSGPNGQDVYFTEEGATSHGDVKIDGTVTPKDVVIEGGTYTFSAKDGRDDKLQATGKLTVAGDANLTLDVESQFTGVDLQGTLELDDTITLTSDGKIEFNGGQLAFGADLADPSNLNAKVKSDGENALRVSVDSTKVEGGVTWGENSSEASGGVKLGVTKGVEKDGDGSFTMAWQDDGTNHEGDVTVKDGTLTLDVNGQADGTKTLLSGEVTVGDEKAGAVLEVKSGANGSVELSGKVSGQGTLKVTSGDVTLSGTNDVADIEVGAGATLTAGSSDALGDAGTTLTLSGGTLAAEAGNEVKSGTVKVTKDSAIEGTVALSGALTSEAGKKLTAGKEDKAASGTISGSLADFQGTLDTAADSSWTLSGKAVSGEVATKVSGAGSIIFNSASDVTYSGEVGDGGTTLKNAGKGELTITSETVSEGAALATDSAAGRIVLGAEGRAVTWSGKTVTGNGELTLSNVELTNGSSMSLGDSTLSINTTGDVSLGDMTMDTVKLLGTVTVNAGDTVRALQGTMTAATKDQFTLVIDSGNVENKARSVGGALFEGADGQLTLKVASADAFRLDFSNGGLISAITSALDSQDVVIHIVENGTLELDEGLYEGIYAKGGSNWELLAGLGMQIKEVSGGDLILTGLESLDVYLVTADGKQDPDYIGGERDTEHPTGYGVLAEKDATLLDAGTTLTVTLQGTADESDTATKEEKNYSDGEGGAIVHNLVGLEDSTLDVQNADSGDKKLVLDNAKPKPATDQGDVPDWAKPLGQDTTFQGTIQTADGIDIDKTGAGTLTVGDEDGSGGLKMAGKDDTLSITEGALKLRGHENELGNVELAYGDPTEGEEQGLILDGGKATVNGDLSDEGVTAKKDAAGIQVNKGGELTLKGKDNELSQADITGDGSGTVKLDKGASLTLSGEAKDAQGKPNTQLSGVGVTLAENSTLDVGKGENDVTKLEGSGTLKSADGGKLTVSGDAEKKGGSFSGTLAGAGKEGKGKAGTLAVADGVDFTLDNASSTGSKENAWGVELGKGANLTVDVSKKSPKSDSDKLTLGNVDLGDGTMTVDFGENPVNKNALEANIAGVGKDGELNFHSNGRVSDGDVNTGITVDKSLKDTFPGHVKFTGVGNFLKDRKVSVNADGELTVTTEEAEENKFERVMPNGSKNALAGATMMWDSLKDKSQLQAFFDALSDPESDYEKLTLQLISMFDNGQNAGLESALEAVAGSSISTLGPALAEDLHRQLKAIRNRTTTMGSDVSYDSYDDMPMWHAWINGEGGYHKLDSDGGAPGYTLNNWGGTVGVDIDVAPQATVGLAITAMYGDLKPRAVDGANGHLDTTYLSAFLRATSGAWIHTFVVSGGLADVQLDRTVNYGAGNYRTKGSTDGYAMGAMYEVGYTRLVNKEGTMALQPVFNAEVRHASVKGYSETGSDAGLRVDDITQDVVTFGAGVRMQSVLGENAFNRSSIFEARVLMKVDVGDHSGRALNGIVGSATMAEVESAKVGAVGVEVGAGLTIPLGSQYGSVFLDGSLEWRNGWMSADAALGYRLSF